MSQQTSQPKAKLDPQKPRLSARLVELAPKIGYIIFLLAWTVISMLGSQLIVSLILSLLLGPAINQPAWMLVYYILSYSLALFMLIYVPPKIIFLCQKTHQKKNANKLPGTDPITLTNSNTPARPSSLASSLSPSLSELGLAKWPTFVDLGLVPVAYISYLIIAGIITQIMTNFPWFDADQAQDVGFSPYGGRIFAMIAVVFIAPIVEETIMRGWLYGKLRSKTKVWVAMILTSLLFAVLHGQWNVAVSTFVLSMILCGLREITGSIWSGMLTHILMNGVAFYLLFVLNM